MGYHNVRDASGKFTSSQNKKKVVVKSKKKTSPKKEVKKERIVSFYLLDDTGSMVHTRQATIEGFNKVLRESRSSDKINDIESREVLALFGGTNSFDLKPKIDELTYHTYNPSRGSTAIYANIIKAINELDRIVKPGDKVILTVITDGENNDGYNFQQSCKNMISEKNTAGWVINFIGAGDKLFVEKVAQSININVTNTLNYADTEEGKFGAFASLSASRGFYSNSVKEKKSKNVGFFANKK